MANNHSRTQTEFLDSMALRAVYQKSDFRLRDLKREDVSLYVCLPAMRMATHANWLRVLITQALIAFEGEPARGQTAGACCARGVSDPWLHALA